MSPSSAPAGQSTGTTVGWRMKERKGQSHSTGPQDAEVQFLGLAAQVALVPGQQPASMTHTLE